MKKNTIKYIILALVAIIAFALFNNTSSSTKPVMGRIDISTKLVNAKKPQFEIYVDGSETPKEPAEWMIANKIQGYVIQKDTGKTDIVVKALANSEIRISLRGEYKRDNENNFVPVWVDFTSLTVDGTEVLSETTPVWHNKPFIYTLDAKNGQEYKIHAEWKKH